MTAIRKATGFSPTWVRAMGGGIDSTGMKAVIKTGQLYCNWSVDSYDSHRRYTPPNVLYHNVVDHVRPGDVILVHQTHRETIEVLPRICKELRRRGYKMVTLSELAAASRPR
jgi:peptidoglycan/xylan/chitin deacetylase (PgdA/CDA1 family)